MATGSRSFDSAIVGELDDSLRALAPRLAAHSGPAVISFDLPFVDPLQLWRRFPDEEATYWKAPSGPRLVAIGRVRGIAAGPGAKPDESASSLAQLRERLLHLDAHTGEPCQEPVRLYGGAAFDADGDRGVWKGFGGGGFVLPELCLEESGEAIRCRLAVDCSREDGLESAMVRIGILYRDPAESHAQDRDSERGLRDRLESAPGVTVPEGWVDLVEQARRQIRDRRLRKVVICRRAPMALGVRLDATEVLARLSSRTNEYVFGLRRGGMTFLGASPELLMKVSGRQLKTEALAGTRELDPRLGRMDALTRAAEELFGSGKDLEEHALVVRGIVDELEPLVERRTLSPWPEVRGLTGLAHLCSRIEAELREGVGPFEVLTALHPTPAVGGLPREEALRFLSRSEPVERGWYAGPVGWVTTAGDAEIAVGIRSALLSAGTAWLYAGAGIVLASDPEAEYRETDAKLRRLSSALGVSEIPG